MVGRGLSILCLLAFGTLEAGGVLAVEPIDLILIGHVVSSYNPVTTFLDPDPSVRYTMVPTSESHAAPLSDEDAKRWVRQYFPRSYEELAGYGFIFYSIPYMLPLSLRQISWLKDSVAKGDCAALTDQGGLRLDVQYAHFWHDVGLSDPFANDAEKVLQTGKVTYSNMGYRLQVDPDAPHQILQPLVALGLEQIPTLGLFHTVPKEGAVTVARAKGKFVDIPGSPDDPPWLMRYEYGRGSTWTLCDNFVNPFWCGMYYGAVQGDLQTDVLMNIIWYSVGMQLPEDAALVHRVRMRFRDYIAKRALEISLMEFVDKLGANLVPVEKVLARADGIRGEAELLYLEQGYEETSGALQEAFDLLRQASDMSLRAKQRALLWIYVIEWTAVSGTLMMCGVVVYSLMVRRLLYREAKSTRLA